jgi:hypothetical protein
MGMGSKQPLASGLHRLTNDSRDDLHNIPYEMGLPKNKTYIGGGAGGGQSALLGQAGAYQLSNPSGAVDQYSKTPALQKQKTLEGGSTPLWKKTQNTSDAKARIEQDRLIAES